MSLGNFCQQSLPCGHEISMQFGDSTFSMGVSCNRRFVDTVLSLGLQKEDCFAFYEETNHLRQVTERFLLSASCHETPSGIEGQFCMNRPWSSGPPIDFSNLDQLPWPRLTDKGTQHFGTMPEALAFMAQMAHGDEEVELHFSPFLLRGLLRHSGFSVESSLRAISAGQTATVSTGLYFRFLNAGFKCLGSPVVPCSPFLGGSRFP